MIRAADFMLESIQCAAWTPVDSRLRPRSVLRQILAEWGEVYDGDPLVLPLPEDTPAEIPTVVIPSQDQRSRIEVSSERVSLVWQRITDSEADLDTATQDLSDRLIRIFGEQRRVMARAALMVTRITQGPQPASEVARELANPRLVNGPLASVDGFEMHIYRRMELPEHGTVNTWMRFTPVMTRLTGAQHLSLQQDINTPEEERDSRQLDAQGVSSFVQAARHMCAQLLEEYFPVQDAH